METASFHRRLLRAFNARPSRVGLVLLIAASALSRGEDDHNAIKPLLFDSSVLEKCDPTFEFFSPKVDLGALRFVFGSNDKLYTELNSDQENLFEEYVARFQWEDLYARYTSIDVPLPPDDDAAMMKRIPEQPGDPNTVILFDGGRFIDAKLLGLTLYGSGDGYRGFLGRLDALGYTGNSGDENYLRPVGLSLPYRLNAETRRYKELPAKPMTPEVQKALEEIVAKVNETDKATLLSSATIYYRYPRLSGVCARFSLEGKDSQVVYAFYKEQGIAWRICPFEMDDSHDQSAGGGILEFDENSTHFSFRDVELHALPDSDGDGSSEIMLVSEYRSILFSLDNKYVSHGDYQLSFVERRSIYFGL